MFPERFLWGAATSAYQVEGAPLADGAGPSIWHRFAHEPGRVANGDTGDVACDHYRRWAGDVALLRELGLSAYRFSIAWARVMPSGRPPANPPGLAFYDRLVDALLEHGIAPMVTLYHWDLPAALDDAGGWADRDSAAWFAEYAGVVARALGDRVALWATLNEPWVVVDGGYVHGVLAPGRRDLAEAARVAHNLLRAHGAAVDALRAHGAQQVGLVVNLEPKSPATDSDADRAATRRAEAYMNRQFLDPVLRGAYPGELAAIYGRPMDVQPGDMERIGRPLDWIGVNYYTRGVTRADPAAVPAGAATDRSSPLSHMTTGWEVYPQGLGETLDWVTGRYGRLPLYVTENGGAFADAARAADLRPDAERRDLLAAHLRALRGAMDRGADVRGYFAWSLLDNFEWAHGYDIRFGLVHVDYATQARTIKASGRLYADVIRTRGGALGQG